MTDGIGVGSDFASLPPPSRVLSGTNHIEKKGSDPKVLWAKGSQHRAGCEAEGGGVQGGSRGWPGHRTERWNGGLQGQSQIEQGWSRWDHDNLPMQLVQYVLGCSRGLGPALKGI